jgi:gliding motility-associated-like protein
MISLKILFRDNICLSNLEIIHLMKQAFFVLFAMLVCHRGQSQPSRDWDKTFGSTNWDELHLITPTLDGGYLLVGNLSDPGPDVTQPVFGGNDVWVIKTDRNGTKLWDKVFGGNKEDKIWSVLPLANGDFLMGGSSSSDSSGNKTSPNIGGSDFWLFKMTAEGDKIWEKTVGGTEDDHLFVLSTFTDNNWLLAGYTNSGISGNKTTDSLGLNDAWAMKMDAEGNIIWQQLFGGDKLDNFYDAIQTQDGGFILGGSSSSGITSTKTENCRGLVDYWIIKIDEDGNKEWDKRYGGNNVDQLEEIIATKDGNYLLTGASLSNVSYDHYAPGRGGFDYWLVKINPEGKQIWDKTYGGSQFDGPNKVMETPTGTIFIGGTSDSPVNGTKKSENLGGYDFWLLYIDENGNQIWDKTYGGSKYDAMTEIIITENSSLLLAGHSESAISDSKSEESRGKNDFWLFKTFCNLEVDLPSDYSVCPNLPLEVEAIPQNCANNDCKVYWSNGGVGESNIFVQSNSQNINVIVQDRSGCFDQDYALVSILSSANVYLGNDTTIFEDGNLEIDLSDNDANFIWSDGSNNSSINITKSGTYAVTATASTGCTSTDELKVCVCEKRNLFIPNVFQPNENIYNDTWYVQSKLGAIEVLESIEIFDSWGHRVFGVKNAQPNDKNFGWNGYDKGVHCLPGVYTYMLRVKYTDTSSDILYGTVTLIR